MADRDKVSINQFIATAVAEKAAALLTVDYLEERGRRGNAKLFDRLLARVPDVSPLPGDALSDSLRQAHKALQPPSRARRKGKSRRTSRAARG